MGGTVLIDLDRRLQTQTSNTTMELETAIQGARSHTDETCGGISALVTEMQNSLDVGVQSIQKELDMHGGIESRLGVKLDSVQVALEQKIGMVQLEVDQVRLDMQQASGRS